MNARVVSTCDESRRWCKHVVGKRLLGERIVESDHLGCFSRSWRPATRQYENTAQPAVATLWGRSRTPERAVVLADRPGGIRITGAKRDGIIAIQSVDDVLGVARVVSRTDENGEGPASVVIPTTDLAAQAAAQPTHRLDELGDGWSEGHDRLRRRRRSCLTARKEVEAKLHIRARIDGSWVVLAGQIRARWREGGECPFQPPDHGCYTRLPSPVDDIDAHIPVDGSNSAVDLIHQRTMPRHLRDEVALGEQREDLNARHVLRRSLPPKVRTVRVLLISGLIGPRQEVVNIQLIRCLLDPDVTVAVQIAQQHAIPIRKDCVPGIKVPAGSLGLP